MGIPQKCSFESEVVPEVVVILEAEQLIRTHIASGSSIYNAQLKSMRLY
jgi:hypothetical protein